MGNERKGQRRKFLSSQFYFVLVSPNDQLTLGVYICFNFFVDFTVEPDKKLVTFQTTFAHSAAVASRAQAREFVQNNDHSQNCVFVATSPLRGFVLLHDDWTLTTK